MEQLLNKDIKLTKNHLIIIQNIANKIWSNYSDETFVQNKIAKNNSINIDNIDNVYFLINQFDNVLDKLKLWRMIDNLGKHNYNRGGKPNKLAQELSAFIEDYIKTMLNI
jgi:hypothetical protein